MENLTMETKQEQQFWKRFDDLIIWLRKTNAIDESRKQDIMLDMIDRIDDHLFEMRFEE